MDKDGTMTDSHVYWGFIIKKRAEFISRKFANSNKDLLNGLMKAMGWRNDVKLLPKDGPIAIKSRDEVVEQIKIELARHGILISTSLISEVLDETNLHISHELDNFVRPIPMAIDFMRRVSSHGIKICIVTSDKEANGWKAADLCGIREVVDFVVGGDSGFGTSKGGGPALEACRRLQIDPSEAICIGDAEMDYEMYKSAGLKQCVLVSTGQIPFEDLQKIGSPVVRCLSNVHI